MTTDADIDLLFEDSGYTLSSDTASAPCAFWNADEVEQLEAGVGGVTLNSLAVLTRASAFPDLCHGEDLTLTSDDATETRFTVQGTPLRIQDGLVLQITLQAEEQD